MEGNRPPNEESKGQGTDSSFNDWHRFPIVHSNLRVPQKNPILILGSIRVQWLNWRRRRFLRQSGASDSTSNLSQLMNETRSPEEILAEMGPIDRSKTVINSLAFMLLAFRCHTGRFPTQEEG